MISFYHFCSILLIFSASVRIVDCEKNFRPTSEILGSDGYRLGSDIGYPKTADSRCRSLINNMNAGNANYAIMIVHALIHCDEFAGAILRDNEKHRSQNKNRCKCHSCILERVLMYSRCRKPTAASYRSCELMKHMGNVFGNDYQAWIWRNPFDFYTCLIETIGCMFKAATQDRRNQSSAAIETCRGMLALRERCDEHGGRCQYSKTILQSFNNISLLIDTESDTIDLIDTTVLHFAVF